jgi:hypothetical protein
MKRTRREVFQAIRGSANLSEAGQKLGGVSRERARQLCNRHGIQHGFSIGRHGSPVQDRLSLIPRWMFSVLSNADLAKLADCSEMPIRKYLKDNGISAAKYPIKGRWIRRAAISLRRRGVTLCGVAEALHICTNHASRSANRVDRGSWFAARGSRR